MILVDTSVIVDIIRGDAEWAARSENAVRAAAQRGAAVGPVTYAELAAGLSDRGQLDAALATMRLTSIAMTEGALFLAGRAFAAYRARGGLRASILPDFFVGAHAAALGASVLTRDPRRLRTSFPDVEVIEP